MPQISPIIWILIFLSLIMFIMFTISSMNSFTSLEVTNNLVIKNENSISW